MSGRADQHLQAVHAHGKGTARVLQLDRVHGAGRMLRADVLVQVRVGLACGDLPVIVGAVPRLLDFRDGGSPVDGRVRLVGLPPETGGLEAVDVRPLPGGARIALHIVDVGEIPVGLVIIACGLPRGVEALAALVGERAVHELRRQAAGLAGDGPRR